MSNAISPDDPVLRVRFNQLYREFLDRRRTKTTLVPQRRHSLEPGESLDTRSIADVVESFWRTVEMYLPDYIAKALPLIRKNKGWAWFHANWGYEESRHSIALGLAAAFGHAHRRADGRPGGTWFFSKSGNRPRTALMGCSFTRWCRSWRPGCTTATCASVSWSTATRP